VPPHGRFDLVLAGDVEDVDRFAQHAPVIVIGPEEADAVDRVHAFRKGCDDYVPRPFDYQELVERIRAVLRRSRPAAPDLLEAGPVRIDTRTRDVRVSGRRIHLSQKEYELLVKLAREPDRVFTKEELLYEVWDYRAPARTRTLDSHASRLRRKLREAGTRVPGAWVAAQECRRCVSATRRLTAWISTSRRAGISADAPRAADPRALPPWDSRGQRRGARRLPGARDQRAARCAPHSASRTRARARPRDDRGSGTDHAQAVELPVTGISSDTATLSARRAQPGAAGLVGIISGLDARRPGRRRRTGRRDSRDP
jgi:hypothetical protein